MSDIAPAAPPAGIKKVPGPVIFVAIMNFLSVSFLGIISFICLMALIFGNIMGLYDIVSRQMSQYASTPNYSYGVTFIFGAVMAVCLTFVLFFVLLGIGLLKRKKTAWYTQVVLCVLGLFAFPLGTIFNGVILFLFFRQPIRDFFEV